MTVTLPSSSSRPGAHGAAAVGFAAIRLLGRLLFRPVKAAVDRRRLTVLMNFDDRMLADIGVTRFDVESALVTGGDALASEALARRARERRFADRARQREATRGNRF